MSSGARTFTWPAALLALLAVRGSAHAEPPASAPAAGGDKALAEALFRAGKELQAAGKLGEACAKYVESHRLDPKPGTILNVATCHEEEGKTATAWADYAEAATFAARSKQAEREKFARTRADELAKKLSFVTFHFPKTTDIEVVLDGKALSNAAAGTRVPLDPGPHAVEARAPAKAPWSTRIDVAPGPAERSVDIPALEDETPVPPPSPVALAASPEPSGRGNTQRALGWVGVGVGGVGLVLGTIFGAKTLSEKSTVDEHCRGTACDAIGLRANDNAYDNAAFSTAGFVVGGLVLTAGILLLVTAPSSSSGASSPARAARAGLFEGVW